MMQAGDMVFYHQINERGYETRLPGLIMEIKGDGIARIRYGTVNALTSRTQTAEVELAVTALSRRRTPSTIENELTDPNCISIRPCI